MYPSLEGKVAIITGAGSGIGQAGALRLAERGATVIVQDISAKGAAETLRQIEAAGGKGFSYLADVSDIAAIQGVVCAVEERFGRIDILVNNAGTVNDFCPIEEVTPEMFERSIAVHVRGTLFATQAAVPGMKKRRYGKIVNMSSIQGTVGNPNGATYNAAKGALLSMAKGWAKEFGPFNIMVNCVAPGPTITPMVTTRLAPEYFTERAKQIPLGRWGTAEDISYAISFLSGPESDFITGQAVSPNGGVAIT